MENPRTEGPNSYQTDPWTETKAYIGLDPLLSDLHKQYLDAQEHGKSLRMSFGKNDPMAQVAYDTEASAREAMETRLKELKEDEALRSVVAYRLRKAEIAKEMDEESEELSALSKAYWARIRGYNERVREAENKRKEGETGFVMAMFYLGMVVDSLRVARRKLSIAAAFGAVTDPEAGYRRAATG